jgi:hypothetical protein
MIDFKQITTQSVNVNTEQREAKRFWAATVATCMGVLQRVVMDSLKFHPGLSCPTLLRPAGGPPLNVFYPIGHPTLYAYGYSGHLGVSCLRH